MPFSLKKFVGNIEHDIGNFFGGGQQAPPSRPAPTSGPVPVQFSQGAGVGAGYANPAAFRPPPPPMPKPAPPPPPNQNKNKYNVSNYQLPQASPNQFQQNQALQAKQTPFRQKGVDTSPSNNNDPVSRAVSAPFRLAANFGAAAAGALTGNNTAENHAKAALGNSARDTWSDVQNMVTRPAAELATSVIPANFTWTPGGDTQAIFGKTPIQNIEKKVTNNYDTHKNLPGWERVGLAAGEGAGSFLQDVPILKGATTIAKLGGLSDAAKEAALAESATRAQGAPRSGVANPLKPVIKYYKNQPKPDAVPTTDVSTKPVNPLKPVVNYLKNQPTPEATPTTNTSTDLYNQAHAEAGDTKFKKGEGSDTAISKAEMQDIINTHRQRFDDSRVQFGNGKSGTTLGDYNFHKDMINIADGDKGTYDHESIHKAIGQFLDDKQIEQLYKDVVKLNGGKLRLQAHYAQNGYKGISWRGAAEEEIANVFTDYLEHGVVKPHSVNTGHNFTRAWLFADKHGLPTSLVDTLQNLYNKIRDVYGGKARAAASGRLKDFYDQVERGDFKGAPRRDFKYEEPTLRNKVTGALEKELFGRKLGQVENSTKKLVAGSRRAVSEPAPKPYTIKPSARPKGLRIPAAVPDATYNAARTLGSLYNEGRPTADNLTNLLNKFLGHATRFSKAGDQLQHAMEGDYTPEEVTAARNSLEGLQSDVGDQPHVQGLTRTLKQLNDMGYDVLDRTHTSNVHRVQQYATRMIKAVKPQPGETTGQTINRKLQNVFNARSGFALNRSVQKFVNTQTGEAKYGTQSGLGLKKVDGKFVGAGGVEYRPHFATQEELSANSPYEYETNHAKVTNNYHSSVGRAKAAADVKQELLSDPEKYDLSTEAQPGYVPVTGIKELDGYYAPMLKAKLLDNILGVQRPTSIGERAFQTVSRGVVQSIVMNPLFHGRNLNELAGLAAGKVKGFTGPAQLKKSMLDVMHFTPEEDAAIDDRMHVGGVHQETYGADQETVLTKAMDSAGLPHLSKFSSAPMAGLDWYIRKSLFHLVTSGEGALADEQAAALVNHFLGGAESNGVIARNIGLFWKYMTTRLGVVKDVAQHPLENKGTLQAGAVQAAVLYGTTRAFQEWTGNKHASIGHPGIAGLVNEANEIRHGQATTAVTSSINPVITAALNQLYGKDMYTGKTLATPGARVTNALNTLVAPTQNIDKVTGGKASAAQEGLQALTGISTPHVGGAPAVPNKGNPLSFINQKGAKPVADEKNPQGKVIVHDPTGLSQATLYYNAKNKGLKAVAGNQLATDVMNAYLDDNTGPKGVKIKKSPEQSMGVAEMLAGTPDALDAMRKLQQAQPDHDPMWDLSNQDLKTFLRAQGNSESSGVKAADKVVDTKFNNGEGFTNFLQRRGDFYDQNKFTGTAQPNPESPTYPTFKGQQQTDYNAYEASKDKWDGKQKAAYLQAHPLAADALNEINSYYDNLNAAQTGLHLKQSMQLTPSQQTWYNWYNNLPKGTGARSAAIKGDPAMWNAISQALAQTDLVNLAKQGAIDQYKGVPFDQTFLKDASNAGKYDIAQGADGKYVTNDGSAPAAAAFAAQAGTSTSPSSSASFSPTSSAKKSSSVSFAAKNAAFKAQRQERVMAKSNKIISEQDASQMRRLIQHNTPRPKKGKTVHLKGSSEAHHYYVDLPGISKPKGHKVRMKAAPTGKTVRLKVR